MKRFAFLLLLLAISFNAATAQAPVLPLPQRGASPLLHVRFQGPAGLKFTLYQGRPSGSEFPVDTAVGLRPGYVYRLKVSGFPNRPQLTLFPTLEVYGTLQLLPKLDPRKFPAPIVFTTTDVERVLLGSMLTKVLYLEDPRWPSPQPAIPGRPVEQAVAPTANLVKETLRRGRPLLVLRMGNRGFDDEELAEQSVPGTILLPGQVELDRPSVPAPLIWSKVPLYDGVLGPRHFNEECLFDGGDTGPKLSYDPEGRLRNFDPEDTLAEYRDAKGRRRIAVSNRVTICVPRFAVLRVEKPIGRLRAMTPVQRVHRTRTQGGVHSNAQSVQITKHDQLLTMKMRERASESRNVTVTSVQGKIVGTGEIIVEEHLRDLTGGKVKPRRDVDRPLVLKKWADKDSAQIGDVITIYLKYSNGGGSDITEVVVADSLTNRLEYVAGSAQSSRNAVFTTQPNESGSVIVRWEITGTLRPGEAGVVSFQVRVR